MRPEPRLINAAPFEVYTSFNERNAAEAAGVLNPGQMYLTLIGGAPCEVGFVGADGEFIGAAYNFTAAQLGALSWDKVIGDDVDITVDGDGVTLTAEAGSDRTGVRFAGIVTKGPTVWQPQIEVVSVTSPTLNMLAAGGWHDGATLDWVASGFLYTTSWRDSTWQYNWNAGVPIEGSDTGALDLGAYVASPGGLFNASTITKTGNVMWGNTSMADASSGTLRTTAGSVSTLANVLSPFSLVSPTFQVKAPAGKLVARLTGLKVSSPAWFGFW